MKPKIPVITRLLKRHTKDANGCWIWDGPPVKWGYGHIKVEDKVQLVHRESYKTFKGEIPNGLLVCHSCDNPICINPEHLWLGTNADNAKDKVSKNRQSKIGEYPGEKHHNAKLTNKDVMDIRASTLTPREISKAYPVTVESIRNIRTYRSWKHI